MALEPLNRKWESFGFDVKEADGNDPAAFIEAVGSLDRACGLPHVIIAHTIKGKGVSFIEDRAAWHHKIPVGDQVRKRPSRSSSNGAGPQTGLREVMVQAFIRAVDEGRNLVVVVSDSASTSQIGPSQSRFPERLVNVGIAEQNLMGIAAGFSLGGYTAVTANAAPFATSRANEQLRMTSAIPERTSRSWA